MFNIEYLKQLLIISIALSAITCTLVQKTKIFLKSSKYISLFSLLVNIILGVLFCLTFTNISLPTSLWIGFFSFLGADSIYKSLEGKISSYADMIKQKNTISIEEENIINKEDQ